MLASEEIKSDQNHPGGGPRKSPSLANQGRGQRVWSIIKCDTPDHPMEDDKYYEGIGQMKAWKYLRGSC